MGIVMVWILIATGPRPYFVGVYDSLAECVQMRYDMTGTTSAKKSKLDCKPRPKKPIDSSHSRKE